MVKVDHEQVAEIKKNKKNFLCVSKGDSSFHPVGSGGVWVDRGEEHVHEKFKNIII